MVQEVQPHGAVGKSRSRSIQLHRKCVVDCGLENPKAASSLAAGELPMIGGQTCFPPLADFMRKAKRPGLARAQKRLGTGGSRKAIIPVRKAGEAGNAGDLALVPDIGIDPKKLMDLSDTDLAKRINARLPKIEASIHCAREHANAALEAAIETGCYLNEVKRRIEKGKWGDWMKKHCPNLKQATAYRYMGLARKLSHVINGKTDMTIRQAYLACGILPDAPPAKKQPPDLDHTPAFAPADILAQVRSATQHLQTFEDLPFETLDSSTLDQMTDEWRTMIDVCDMLIEKAAARRKIKQVKAAMVPAQSKSRSAESTRGG